MKSNITFEPKGASLLVKQGIQGSIGHMWPIGHIRHYGTEYRFEPEFDRPTALTQPDLETIAAACNPVMFEWHMAGGPAHWDEYKATTETK